MKNLTKEDWKKLIKETDNAVVIDVRTPEECAEGIQPNAKQINFLSLTDFLSQVEKLDKSNSYFLYCRSGNRSGKATSILQNLGYKNVTNIGGIQSASTNLSIPIVTK